MNNPTGNRHRRGARALRTLASLLIVGVFASACASVPDAAPVDKAVLEGLQAAVPPAWRAAALATPDINPLEISDELRRFVDEQVAGEPTQRRRMRALVDAIFDTDAVGLRYDDSATLTAAETFARGVGNCMSFSNLLVAAARRAGMRANFELMSNFESWQQQGDLVVRTMHVRVLVPMVDRKMVYDFFPAPVARGAWSRRLSDDQARAHHLNNLAAEFMQAGNSPSAYGYLHKALQTSPDLSFVWSNLGVLLYREGLPASAETAFDAAVQLDPEHFTAITNLQRLYRSSGREAAAAALDLQLAERRIRNPYFHFWQAEKALEEARYADAEKHYRDTIRLKPDERRFYVGLATALYEQGKVFAARDILKQGNKIAPSIVDAVAIQPASEQ